MGANASILGAAIKPKESLCELDLFTIYGRLEVVLW